VSDVFSGHSFYVVSGTEEKPKDELEKLIRSFGGTFTQTLG
jgi:hypothetical protein